jgi:hypothetical protein
LLSTNLWPSGGLVAAWNDHGRSFHNLAGVPDVAVQFLPDLPEPAPPVTPYPVSADGKYYYVNLLRRNYAPPTASATLANDAAIYLGFGPQFVFDGDDSPFQWTTPIAADPDATSTMIVDLGQYFSIGAVRPLYRRDGQFNPVSQRVRLATTPGNWTTVVPMTPVASNDTTLSFDATPARYLELTELGANSNAVSLAELFVYPSAQSTPPPTSADGYDLGYLATTSVNDNFFAPGRLAMSWPAGNFWAKTVAQGAIGDAVGSVDLGAQYWLSRLSLCFAHTGTWDSGGRLDVAALPDTFTTIHDSGRGASFGPIVNGCQEYAFPAQPVRYIRSTDYFVPGVGPSGSVLWSVQAFVNPALGVAYYPLSGGGKYFNVSLLARPASAAQPSVSIAYANGPVPYPPSPAVQDLTAAFDGNITGFSWWTSAGANPNATATFMVDLGQVASIGGIGGTAGGFVSYGLRVAETPGLWTQVFSSAPLTANDLTHSFDAVRARYLELTMTGTTASRIASVNELLVYPSSASDPAPSSAELHDLSYLPGMTVSANSNMSMGTNPSARAQQTYYVGRPVPSATGDGTITYDLAQQYQISQINLPFYPGKNWPGGGKIEVDDGSGTWVTVFDSGRGNPLGSVAGTQIITFPTRVARLIRFTDYFIPGVGTSPGGYFLNFDVF